MKKIQFEDGVKIKGASVEIDSIEHLIDPAVWQGNTPLSAFNLNKMQDNIEEEIDTKVADINTELDTKISNVVSSFTGNLNSIATTSIVFAESGATNKPSSTTGFCVTITNANYRRQIFYNFIGTVIYTRAFNSVSWEEWSKPGTINIITGVEIATNEFIDGKQVYVKRIDYGFLINGTLNIPHGLTNVTFEPYRAFFKNVGSGSVFSIPRCYPSDVTRYGVDCDVSSTTVNITGGTQYTGATFRAYVDVRYTKN